MIRYRKIQILGEKSPLKGKWYARPVIDETIDIDGLAKHMALHNTPYSTGAIKGVLTDMVNCIKELVLDGKNVKLDDLAIFSVGIVSAGGADSSETFTVANNVKGLRLRARATGELSNAQINLEGQLKEAYIYDGGGSSSTGSGSNGGGTSSGGGTDTGGGDSTGGGSDSDLNENPLG